MDTISAMLPFLRLFQFSFLTPFALTKNLKITKTFLLTIYSVLMILVCVGAIYFHFVNRNLSLVEEDFSIGRFVFFILQVWSWISLLVIIIESIIKRDSQSKLLDELAEVDLILSNEFNIEVNERDVRKIMLWRFVIWLLCFLGIKSANFIYNGIIFKDPEATGVLDVWIWSLTPFLICCFRNFQIITYILSIKERFLRLHKCLEKTDLLPNQEHRPNSNGKIDEINDISKVIVLENVYAKLWQATLLVNKSFGASIVVNTLTDFLWITACFYNLYVALNVDDNIFGKLILYNDH